MQKISSDIQSQVRKEFSASWERESTPIILFTITENILFTLYYTLNILFKKKSKMIVLLILIIC